MPAERMLNCHESRGMIKLKKIILEACVDSVQSAIYAQEGGADRLELCSNLLIGGVSPGKALYDQVRKNTDIPVRVLLRPRYGDYCYDGYEFEQLKEEVQMYCEAGGDGIVIGLLRPDGNLDLERMKELIKIAGNKKKTLHRAFDVCVNPMKALEEAIEIGFDTILTSGQNETAWEGRTILKELQEKSKGRIEILAASGISAEAIKKLIPYTGIMSYHMSGKIVLNSQMEYRKEGVSIGMPGEDEYVIWQTAKEKIAEARGIAG